MTLWDVFSHGNSVVDAEGRAYDLGSFRSSAGYLADLLEQRYPGLGRRDYMDYYMGTALVAHRADLQPVYRWIFGRLRDAGCDWRYEFPRIHVLRFDWEEEAGFESYDPSAAVEAGLLRAAREEEFRRFQEELDRTHEEVLDRARAGPPPGIVAAYRYVYGALPQGWPA